MRTIYKYEIPFDDKVTIIMPKDAELLKFGIQGTMPNGYPNICVWAMVDTENEKEERHFRIFGTGHPLPENCGAYIVPSINGIPKSVFDWHDTLFDSHGCVWHIFVEEK